MFARPGGLRRFLMLNNMRYDPGESDLAWIVALFYLDSPAVEKAIDEPIPLSPVTVGAAREVLRVASLHLPNVNCCTAHRDVATWHSGATDRRH